ncbi:hypothetical protein KZZ52_41885 [Dactylosporangium sp. AC04546]|uniref:hypothetical protein n=1 Tax=Dactylosporangium sp. AC04546 TaxID=2862460 RepID=UPI001EDE78DE|nr:hypothetical protein [Dactylosporangium sp. AC04546]WVK80477.1 hypothetical protein KZZ52_41885 [Dactylosporangium sp. AC04546]
MVEYFEDTDMMEDDEGWCHLVDAVFVDPEDWVEDARIAFEDDDAMSLVCEGLSAAADERGQLRYFRQDVWYEHHLSGVMRTEEDPQSWSLKSDRLPRQWFPD